MTEIAVLMFGDVLKCEMCTSVDIFICGQWTVHCSDIFSGRAVLDIKKIDEV